MGMDGISLNEISLSTINRVIDGMRFLFDHLIANYGLGEKNFGKKIK